MYTCIYLCVNCALGLSPDLQSMEQIRRLMRPTDVPDQGIHTNMYMYVRVHVYVCMSCTCSYILYICVCIITLI